MTLHDSAGFRGLKGRKKSRAAKQEKKAATTLQAGWRGRIARKRVAVVRTETNAATKIQAGFRGAQARKLVKQERIVQDYRTLYTVVDGVELNTDGSVSRDELEQGLTLTSVTRIVKRGKLNLKKLLGKLEGEGDGDIDIVRFLYAVGAFDPDLGLHREERELKARVRAMAHEVNREFACQQFAWCDYLHDGTTGVPHVAYTFFFPDSAGCG